MLTFFITYLLLLFTGSCFILGWYYITRSGQILGAWERFWEHIESYRKIYYEDELLKERLMFLVKTNKGLGKKLILSQGEKSLSVNSENKLTDDDIFFINDTAALTEIKDGGIIFLYENEPMYRFPEYVRKPMASCPPCMSSVYGSLYWWTIVWLQDDLFRWTSHSSAPFVFWGWFCMSLVFINYFLHKLAKMN